MDPVTTAIIAAVTAGLTSGVTETSKKAIVDAYEALKGLLKKRFGDTSEVVKSVQNQETRPETTRRQGTLKEEIEAVHADQDPEILKAAQELLKLINFQPNGGQYVQNVSGSTNAFTQGGGAATVNINWPPKEQ